MNQAVVKNNPRYVKLRQDLMQRIFKGEPGTKLPSTRQLMQQHEVSQLLVDRCYFELEAQGLLDRRHRFGVFISDRAQKEYQRAKIIGVLANCRKKEAAEFTKGLQTACAPDKSLLLPFTSAESLAKSLEEARESSRPELDGLVCWVDPDEDKGLLASLQSLIGYFRLKAVIAGHGCPSIHADHIELEWSDLVGHVIRKLDVAAGSSLLLVSAPGCESIARQLELELQKVGVLSEQSTTDGKTISPKDGQGTVLIGLEPKDIAGVFSWKAMSGSRRHIVISHQSQHGSFHGNLHYGILPYSEMGAQSYHLLCNRLKEGDQWSPRMMCFSAVWERSLQ
ncbi:MAG: GntR family transcriptional regulator [Planctomycetes bacterium]|jgi:GntR family transcriptional regulator|nr:GntR family transcriptional regulator [Planctomycetota bacterium]